MKMIWHRKRNGRIVVGPVSRVLLFTGIFGGVFLLANAIFPGPLERVFTLGTQSANVGTAALEQTVARTVESREALLTRVAYLEDINATLEHTLLRTTQNTENYNALVEQLRGGVAPQGTLGTVIAWPPKTAYDTLLILLPNEHGVAPEHLVLGRGVVPIGYVREVRGNTAYVTLFSTPGVSTSVRVGAERINGELLGRGGGTAYILFPRDVAVSVEDPIFFPYEGETYLGAVREVITDPTAPVKEVWIEFNRNLFTETWVRIVPFRIL